MSNDRTRKMFFMVKKISLPRRRASLNAALSLGAMRVA
jgi:hypothetical protein